jgi:hypothetical protein
MYQQQELAKKLGFEFRYTRYPKDLEPALSSTLGIPVRRLLLAHCSCSLATLTHCARF